MGAGYALPDDFGELLLRVLDPADAEESAGLILRAAGLSEPELAAFLDAFAERVQASPAPVRAAEIRAWLDGSPPAASAPPPRS